MHADTVAGPLEALQVSPAVTGEGARFLHISHKHADAVDQVSTDARVRGRRVHPSGFAGRVCPCHIVSGHVCLGHAVLILRFGNVEPGLSPRTVQNRPRVGFRGEICRTWW